MNERDVVLRRDQHGDTFVSGLDAHVTVPPHRLRMELGGSRPADLALSILLTFCGDLDWALEHHQAFQRAAIAPIPEEGGVIAARYIAA